MFGLLSLELAPQAHPGKPSQQKTGFALLVYAYSGLGLTDVYGGDRRVFIGIVFCWKIPKMIKLLDD